MNNNYVGFFSALLSVFFFSSLGTIIKLCVQSLDAFVLTFYVGFFATLFLFIYTVLKRGLSEILKVFRSRPFSYILLGILCMGFQQVVYIKAYEYLPATHVVSAFYTSPFMMLIASSLIFKERISFFSYMAILFGFLGVFVLKYEGESLTFLFQGTPALGLLYTLLAAASFALYSVLVRKDKEDVLINTLLYNFFGFLFILILSFWHREVFSWHFKQSEFFGALYLGIFPTALGFILWNKGIRYLKTEIASNLALLTPVLSIILISFVFSEKLKMHHFLGIGMIIGSNILLNYFKKR